MTTKAILIYEVSRVDQAVIFISSSYKSYIKAHGGGRLLRSFSPLIGKPSLKIGVGSAPSLLANSENNRVAAHLPMSSSYAHKKVDVTSYNSRYALRLPHISYRKENIELLTGFGIPLLGDILHSYGIESEEVNSDKLNFNNDNIYFIV